MPFESPLETSHELANQINLLANRLKAKNLLLGTAESCTGGLLAAQLTSFAGSSKWFDRAIITYSNQAKISLLGVLPETIQQHGAVSETCARAMLEGLLKQVDIGVAITGIAGPDGGSIDKPVGTVWFAFGQQGHPPSTRLEQFEGSREAIRLQACAFALQQLTQMLQ
ncbi:MAG: amidohydrolase, PncC family domain protein [Gammaproteobacteria bacterium]|jgi:nicotinamide-nucleotide amidase|nr:amidohydrolase, PncC family domain protein [Gammaproteobacteria bacterium]